MFVKIAAVVLIAFQCVIGSLQITVANSFGHCIKQENPSFITCAGQQAIETLQQFSDANNLTLTEGLVLSKEESVMGRNNPINFLDQDPNDFRSLLENAGAVVSERTLQWDMSRVFPGLQLRVGPSITGGLLEFVVDPETQYDERISYQEESTARILTKKFFLPFLLGIKFNLATLLPIILGAIILLSKKAAFLSKLALFISSFFGFGGLATLGGIGAGLAGGGLGGYGGYGGIGYGGGYGGGLGGGYGRDPVLDSVRPDLGNYKVIDNNTPRTQEEQHLEDHFYEYDKKHLLKDRSSRLHERELDVQERHAKYKPTSQRNFVWATTAN